MHENIRVQLTEMIFLLEAENSDWWVKHFKHALSAFDSNEFLNCANIIMSGSGGLGSLNDLVLGQTTNAKGEFCWKANADELNQKYMHLLGELYAFSKSVQKGN
ncbi:hypothetical protein JF50_11570 [Pseudoalteromonas luteoviolacea]|uniref:Uncharacterized protein n=1 Tax=Pseudoalteromonas luteoviolacea TaxID=43657 RepID=A0A0C1MHZ5_9GAMM|nr:hypothetical protein [Pseudoalteromonas luteoviolacea]KID56569.1 hypothetical protein JF50_11570 [Pseudoalteromonas luteoviolacea]